MMPKLYHLDSYNEVVEGNGPRSAGYKVLQQVYRGVLVSTIFLGVDHNFSGVGPPLLFETMVLGGPLNDYQERCSTWDKAVLQHARILRMVKDSAPRNFFERLLDL